ncbi:hypothetical protein TherJR_1466 [Thermincola potens JR]|uniref:Uncharacterized protein n=1 Tax=Thermincola potens (strain JR) TaxID=635013 RepID=D5XFA0_THEPJ|nr:hypothetical protein TherJR_1466 [Thermincola potens JR]
MGRKDDEISLSPPLQGGLPGGNTGEDLFAAMVGTYKASNAVSGVNKTKERGFAGR